ncbi:MAG: hypothetical protein IJZ62_05960 [Clostridia bacterium]|nr:hypothetical protein [Clostridia bacterium]
MVISGFGAITFSAELNADTFLALKGELVVKKLPKSFCATDEEAPALIKKWEDKGYKVQKSLFKDSRYSGTTYYCYPQYTQEQKDRYNKERLKFIYYYVGERSTFQDAERWVREKCEESGVTFESLELRVPHCFGQDTCCSLFCPYYNKKCSCTVEEFEKQGLQKQYYEWKGKKSKRGI